VSTRQDENPIGSDFDVDVFPNPFVDTLNISLSGSGGADGAVSVFVVDLLGRRIATVAEGIRAGEVRTLTWDAAQIPAGMYFAVIKDGSRRWVKPIIRAN